MISILIPVMNDTENLIKTLNSIEISTYVSGVETIIIDSSQEPIILPRQYKNITIIRQEKNIGPAQSRHLAAKTAKNDILFMADSHTYFPKNWDIDLIGEFKTKKNKIAAFPVIFSKTWDSKYFDYFPVYYGSSIYIKDFRTTNDFFDSYSIYQFKNIKLNAIKVAAYGIDKNYFFSLRGFEDIRLWGSDELCLSIKVLSTGGSINLIPSNKFVHIHNTVGFTRNVPHIYYNKLRLAQSFMDDESYNYLLNLLPKNNHFLKDAWTLVNQDKEEIQEYKKFYKSIFVKNFQEIRKECNILE